MKWAMIATWKMALEGVQKASVLLEQGASGQEALLEAIQAVEKNPNFNSVGYAGLPNCDGIIQLDGGFMDGSTLSVGSVGALEKTASPFELALSVSKKPFNNFLTGEGAQEEARRLGLPETDLMTEETQLKYEQRCKEQGSKLSSYRGHDTVGICCLDQSGNVTVGTSTSGLFMKENGRIGDSPLCGSGFYADIKVGAAAATGVGEEIMKGCLSYEVLRRIKDGQGAMKAASALVQEFNTDLIERRGHAESMSLICLDKNGHYGIGTNLRFAFVYASNEHPAAVYIAQPDGEGCTIRLWNDQDEEID